MKIIKLDTIGSTNSFLKDLSAQEEIASGTCVVANTQNAGRGQRGNTWFFEPNKSLACSVFVRFSGVESTQQFEVLIASTWAVYKLLKTLQIPHLKIKWPNDILSDSKKICGILVETSTKGNFITQAVIGVGLNVNNTVFPELPQASSMFLASKRTFNLDTLTQALCDQIISCCSQVNTGLSFKTKYESVLFKKDKVQVFEINNTLVNGIIRGITNTGELCLETAQDLRSYPVKAIRMHF